MTRYPAIGETWHMVGCTKHGCPSPYPYDFRKFPLKMSMEITEIADYYKELVDCGCMAFGEGSPRLHEPA